MRTLRLSLLLGIGAVLMTAQHATASPLLLAQIVDVSSGFKQQTVSAPPLSLSDAEAAASASFFSVGARAGSGLAASAEADWFDQWTIVGGTGTGTITVSWSLTGELTDAPLSSCVSPGSVCTGPSVTYVSLFDVASIFSAGAVLTSLTDSIAGTEPVSLAGSLAIPFTYGTPFDAGFRLEVSAGEGSSLQGSDFSHTGLLTSVVLPTGASLTTASGAEVPVTPVSEPGTLMLLGTGAVFGASGWRRRHAQARRIGRSTECFQPAPAAWAQPRPAFNSQEL